MSQFTGAPIKVDRVNNEIHFYPYMVRSKAVPEGKVSCFTKFKGTSNDSLKLSARFLFFKKADI